MRKVLALLVLALILLVSCKKDTLPVVETLSANIKDATHATLQGRVINEGSTAVTTRGFCWALTVTPTVNDNFSQNESGSGEFTEVIGILPDSTYYARAYAINSVGTVYGNQVSFSTAGSFTGSFIDSRDGARYRWVKIGSQTWMAENMAYLPAVSPPAEGGWNEPFYYVQGYEGNDVSIAVKLENFEKYGVLYNWKAMQSACPTGWRLASDEDWKMLEDYLGMDPSEVDETDDRTSGEIGKKIKSASDWFEDGNGDNSSGFDARPGGSRNASGKFGSIGMRASFMTGTPGGSSFNFSRGLTNDSNGISRGTGSYGLGLSARCIRK
jgi:uncharacterized protein (TIGR02145 family)